MRRSYRNEAATVRHNLGRGLNVVNLDNLIVVQIDSGAGRGETQLQSGIYLGALKTGKRSDITVSYSGEIVSRYRSSDERERKVTQSCQDEGKVHRLQNLIHTHT